MQEAPLDRSPVRKSAWSAQSVENDAVLVAAARRDVRAFAPLYCRYFDRVYRYCFRRLGGPEAASDATGLIFVNVLSALPRYRDDAVSFRSWLFAIAHNVLVDEFRAHRIHLPLEEAADVPSSSPSVEEQVVATETGSYIRELLTQLTDDQQHVMELRLSGLTGQEIADALGRSLGSVKIAQVRAMKQLRIAADASLAMRERSDVKR